MIESKMLMVAVGDIVRTSKSLQEAYGRISKMANVEGVMLEPFEEADDKEDDNAVR